MSPGDSCHWAFDHGHGASHVESDTRRHENSLLTLKGWVHAALHAKLPERLPDFKPDF